MTKRFDVVALGEALVEFNQTSPDTLFEAACWANAAAAVAVQGFGAVVPLPRPAQVRALL